MTEYKLSQSEKLDRIREEAVERGEEVIPSVYRLPVEASVNGDECYAEIVYARERKLSIGVQDTAEGEISALVDDEGHWTKWASSETGEEYSTDGDMPDEDRLQELDDHVEEIITKGCRYFLEQQFEQGLNGDGLEPEGRSLKDVSQSLEGWDPEENVDVNLGV